jgi:hypothetical protein
MHKMKNLIACTTDCPDWHFFPGSLHYVHSTFYSTWAAQHGDSKAQLKI